MPEVDAMRATDDGAAAESVSGPPMAVGSPAATVAGGRVDKFRSRSRRTGFTRSGAVNRAGMINPPSPTDTSATTVPSTGAASTSSGGTASSESPDPFRGDRGTSCRIALRLDHAERASRRARMTINDFYQGRLDPMRLGDLLLLVSELVTNAMEHGARGLVTLDVALTGDHVTVTVTSPGEPSMINSPSTWRLPEPDQPTGRGLALTARLAHKVKVFGGAGIGGDPGWIAVSAELGGSDDDPTPA